MDELLSSFTRLCSQLFVALMRVKGTEKKQSVPTNDAQKSQHALLPSCSFLNIASTNCFSLFSLFPSCVFIFTFFLFPQLLSITVFIVFLCSQYYVSFTFVFFVDSFSFCPFFSVPLLLVYPFSVSSVFLFSFFTSSLLPQFFFFYLFLLRFLIFYAPCLLFLLFFPSFSILLSSSPKPSLFFSRFLPPL